MSHSVSILLCGAGGYGEWYVTRLLAQAEAADFRFVAAVEPQPEKCSQLGALRERKIPIYSSLEEFFRGNRCDLTILATPFHLHAEQACFALAQGSHVLCEKPLCVGRSEAEEMERAERASGRTVTVGYQWSFSSVIQRFKSDYLASRFGAARRLRTLLLWPREDDYFRRNGWSGRRQLDSGRLVLDSPVNNAGAHYLHNMFYVLGSTPSTSAQPLRVQAELWRAQSIENYDTAALRIETDAGAEILFYASHSTRQEVGPLFTYEFEAAIATYDAQNDLLVTTLSDGEKIVYGSLKADPEQRLWDAIESARSGRPPLCGIAAARAQVACVEMAQQSPGGIRDFRPASVRRESRDGKEFRHVEGLQEIFTEAYRQPSDFETLAATMRTNFEAAVS